MVGLNATPIGGNQMTLADIVATAKRLIAKRTPYDKAAWTIGYLVRDLKPQLDVVQRLTLTEGIYRQAQRELAA